jgi:hypothetical protein
MFRTSSAVGVATTGTAAPSASFSSRGQQRSLRHDGNSTNGADGTRQDDADQGTDDGGGGGATLRSSSSSLTAAAAIAAAAAGATTAAWSNSSRQRALASSSISIGATSHPARIRTGDDDDAAGGENKDDDDAGGGGAVQEAEGRWRSASAFAFSVRSASFVTAPIPAPATGTAVLIRQFVMTLLATLLSWNVPRYLIEHERSIAHKPAPYQVIGNDNNGNHLVVLNPELHHPLVDPPTIPCTYE